MHHLIAGGQSSRAVATAAGVSHVTVLRAVEKFKDKVREAKEFARSEPHKAPRRNQPGGYCWSIQDIRCTRDDQLRGHFKRPVRMAEQMRTDDAIFVAYHNRIAIQNAILATLQPAGNTVRARAVQKKAAASVQIARSVLSSIHGTLADHGIAIGHIEKQTVEGGARVDFKLTEWPLEHVKWNSSSEVLETSTRGGVTVPIVHGDGEWVVFRKFYTLPWTQEACILPAAFVWAAHANGVRDWAATSTSHGQAKVIGELPQGIALGALGALNPEAAAFLQMLQDVMVGEAGVGLMPSGAKANFLANASTAWQVFKELLENREKAAARIYLGTDAILGSVGGAPGVDISALFGVASTKLQGDFEAIEQALRTGVYEPWTAINEGDSKLSPFWVYQLPDTDSARKSEEQTKKRANLMATVKEMKENGFEVTQAVVDLLAAELGVNPSPKLAAAGAAKVSLDLAPTSLDYAVRGREARNSQGLPPFGDARDDRTLAELKADAEAKGKIKEDAAKPTAPAAAPPTAPAAPTSAAARKAKLAVSKARPKAKARPRSAAAHT